MGDRRLRSTSTSQEARRSFVPNTTAESSSVAEQEDFTIAETSEGTRDDFTSSPGPLATTANVPADTSLVTEEDTTSTTAEETPATTTDETCAIGGQKWQPTPTDENNLFYTAKYLHRATLELANSKKLFDANPMRFAPLPLTTTGSANAFEKNFSELRLDISKQLYEGITKALLATQTTCKGRLAVLKEMWESSDQPEVKTLYDTTLK